MLHPQTLSKAAFAPYGDVIEAGETAGTAMNDDRFDRADALARIGGEHPCISVVTAAAAVRLPWKIDIVERHRSTQAFIPLDSFEFAVVVAVPDWNKDENQLRAFLTNGRQGIQYHSGTWHMPLIAFAEGQRFVVIDQGQQQPTETWQLKQALLLAGPGVTC